MHEKVLPSLVAAHDELQMIMSRESCTVATKVIKQPGGLFKKASCASSEVL